MSKEVEHGVGQATLQGGTTDVGLGKYWHGDRRVTGEGGDQLQDGETQSRNSYHCN